MGSLRSIIRKFIPSGKPESDLLRQKKEFYTQFIFPQSLSDFNQFIQRDCGSEGNEKRDFKRQLDFGIKTKDILKILGTPNFQISQQIGKNKYEVIFFKMLIDNHKVIKQVHLLDDSFFFCCYTFHQVELNQLVDIKAKIFQTYNIPYSKINDIAAFVKDKNNKTMMVHENIHLKISCLTGDPAQIREITTLIENSTLGLEAKKKHSFSMAYTIF